MEPNLKEITLKIDGQEVKAKEGATILDVAKGMGIKIPTLCYLKALSPFGSCRMCSVEIVDKRGRSRLVTSCNYPVEEGLVVYTKSEKTIKTRKTLLELLLARCPKVPKIQEMALEYGIQKSSFWTEDEDEDCILCGLCARVCDELVGVHAINFAGRGVEREVTTPYHALSNDCIGCGACATVCPTKSKKTRINTYPVLEEDAKKLNEQFLKGTFDHRFPAVRTSVSEIPVDREFESHQPHLFHSDFSTAFKYPRRDLKRQGAEMFRDILTTCWSIKEVNKNLADRKPTSDYSIRYLKKACSVLAGHIRELGKSMPDEEDRSGRQVRPEEELCLE